MPLSFDHDCEVWGLICLFLCPVPRQTSRLSGGLSPTAAWHNPVQVVGWAVGHLPPGWGEFHPLPRVHIITGPAGSWRKELGRGQERGRNTWQGRSTRDLGDHRQGRKWGEKCKRKKYKKLKVGILGQRS